MRLVRWQGPVRNRLARGTPDALELLLVGSAIGAVEPLGAGFGSSVGSSERGLAETDDAALAPACSFCGALLEASVRVCPTCAVPRPQPPIEPISEVTAERDALLASLPRRTRREARDAALGSYRARVPDSVGNLQPLVWHEREAARRVLALAARI